VSRVSVVSMISDITRQTDVLNINELLRYLYVDERDDRRDTDAVLLRCCRCRG